MNLKFNSKEWKQQFLGKLFEKNASYVDLLDRPYEVYIVTLANEDAILSKQQFNRMWKHIKSVADMFGLRVVVASMKPNYWALSEEGKKLTKKQLKNLFTNEEWSNFEEHYFK